MHIATEYFSHGNLRGYLEVERSEKEAKAITRQCKRTSEESGTIGGRKEKELVDDELTTGKHPTI